MSNFNAISSPDNFRTTFIRGLNQLLKSSDNSLGSRVLVLANAIAIGDEQLLKQVKEQARQLLQDLPAEQVASEDAQVLRFVLQQSHGEFIRRRTTPAGWTVLDNQLRHFRPTRDAVKPASEIHRPFDSAKFHFGKVLNEAYCRVVFGGTEQVLFYQKYPLEPYHSMLVPEPEKGREQFLDKADHYRTWQFCWGLGAGHTGAMIAYNSLGAFASVNHLHFHLVLEGAKLPIWQSDRTKYPVATEYFTDDEAAWARINELQTANQPFNLLYRPGQMILIPRRFQGTYDQPAWTSGFAWYELSGGLYTTNAQAFETLTDQQIEAAMREVVG